MQDQDRPPPPERPISTLIGAAALVLGCIAWFTYGAAFLHVLTTP
jgi:hypothetical protein